jgi:hypothetical protein
MKNKIIATIAAFSLVGSAHAVDVNDNLSISGFIDGSYQSSEPSNAADTQQLGIDEVEIDFLFNVASVSGEVHVDNGADGSSDFDIEQAHFSYGLENGVNFTFGRFGSSLGLEREDPAGVYSSSRAYSTASGFNLGDVNNNVFDGIAVGYSADAFSINAAFVNQTGNRAALETNDIDLEVSINYTGIENLNLGLGYFFDNRELNTNENDVLNIHASTAFGKLFLAAEYNEIKNSAQDRDAYLLLADYDLSDKFGITARVSSYETVGSTSDTDKITIAPNYSITDSLGLIVEYSDTDTGSVDTDSIAVELTYTYKNK